MKIKFWQVLAFVAIVVGITVLVFPLKRDMVVYYLEAGQLKKARWLLDELLARNPDDPDVLLAAARIYQLEGRPRKSIAVLKQVLEERPRDLDALTLLAKYQEWMMRPLEAAEAYERILALKPDRPDILVKLVNWYRYFDMLEKEVDTILRLVPLLDERDRQGGPFARDLLTVLASLADVRAADGPDAYRGYLIQHLFVLLQQWVQGVEAGEEPDVRQFAIYVMENYLAVGDLDGAAGFAERLDKWRGGFDGRLAYVAVLRWNGLYERALAFLEGLEKSYPDDEKLLLAKAGVGKDSNRLDVAERAMHRLTVINPDNEEYHDELAQLYLRQEKYGQAVMVYQRLIQRAKEAARHVRKMLAAALGGGDRQVMRQAAATAASVKNPTREIKDALIDTYLALEEPAKAFPLAMEKVEAEPKADKNDVLALLDVAGYAGRPEMVDQASVLALSRFRKDPDVLRAVAKAYMAAGLNARAFAYYKDVFQATGSSEDVRSLLETAGYEAKEPLVAEAASLVEKRRPDDHDLMALAGEVFLWLSLPRQAYPYLKRAAILSKGRGADLDQMLAAASYTGDRKLMTDAAVTAQKLRPDDAKLAMVAAEYLYQAGDVSQGSKIMDRLAKLTKEDKAVLLKHAQMAEAAGANEQAFRLYKRLYDAFPSDTSLRGKVVQLAEWTGRPEVAADILGRMSDEMPGDFSLAERAGRAWGDAGKPEKAVPYLVRAHALKPGDTALLELLAEFYGYAGMSAKQVAALRELEKAKPLKPAQELVLARAYVDEKKGAEALPYLERALAGKAPDKDQGLLLATALVQAGQGGKADQVFMDLGQRYSGDPGYLAGLGLEALWAERPKAAQGLFDLALEADPYQPTALRGSAVLAAASSDDRKASAMLRRYLKVKPGDAEAHYLLGQIYDARNSPDMAFGQYRKALRLLARDTNGKGRAGQ